MVELVRACCASAPPSTDHQHIQQHNQQEHCHVTHLCTQRMCTLDYCCAREHTSNTIATAVAALVAAAVTASGVCTICIAH
eukprot:9056-Heterococcus_DN1.PRE.3